MWSVCLTWAVSSRHNDVIRKNHTGSGNKGAQGLLLEVMEEVKAQQALQDSVHVACLRQVGEPEIQTQDDGRNLSSFKIDVPY